MESLGDVGFCAPASSFDVHVIALSDAPEHVQSASSFCHQLVSALLSQVTLGISLRHLSTSASRRVRCSPMSSTHFHCISIQRICSSTPGVGITNAIR